tara:strand:- start:451 stop:1002 length:552 start_codon:yes stop_codon:yes gene_type:complete
VKLAKRKEFQYEHYVFRILRAHVLIRSFFSQSFFTVGVFVIFGSLATMAEGEARDITCGNILYTIETSWFGTDVIINDVKGDNVVGNAKTSRPYCQSNAATQMEAELSVKGNDIWCVEKFYISMNRLPIAKSSRLLSLALGKVFEYDYLWQAGGWVKTDRRTVSCNNDEIPERQKILDNRTLD